MVGSIGSLTNHRYFGLGLQVERPANVMAWFIRLREWPAYVASITLPLTELYGRLAF